MESVATLNTKNRKKNSSAESIDAVLQRAIDTVLSEDPIILRQSAADWRKVCHSTEMPHTRLVATGLLPNVIDLIASDNDDTAMDALRGITGLTGGAHEIVEHLVQSGLIGMTMSVLDGGRPHLQEDACWSIGNIAGDDKSYQTQLLESEAVALVRNLLRRMQQDVLIKRVATWTLSNLVRGKVDYKYGSQILPEMIQMANDDDNATREDALWAISYICDSDNDSDQIASAMTPKLLEALFDNIRPDSIRTRITPALRAIGNLTTGASNQPTHLMIVHPYRAPKTTKSPASVAGKRKFDKNRTGVLPLLAELASSISTNGIRRELMWCISNILAGGSEQTAKCIRHGIMDAVILTMTTKLDITDAVRKEALWCVINAFSAASDVDFRALVLNGKLINLLFSTLNANYNTSTVNAALLAIHRILFFASTLRQACFSDVFDDPITSLFLTRHAGLIERLVLQNHQKAIEVQALLDNFCLEISSSELDL